MEAGETVLCSFICDSEYTCEWSKWNNPVDQQFPDGTFQTCVGAQVRCGCTCAMRLVSFFTYEHPTAFVVLLFFIITFILIMTIKFLCQMSNCAVLCCGKRVLFKECSDLSQHTVASSLNDLEGEVNCNVHVDDFQDYFAETEKPPPYSIAAIHRNEDPPPPYYECAKKSTKS